MACAASESCGGRATGLRVLRRAHAGPPLHGAWGVRVVQSPRSQTTQGKAFGNKPRFLLRALLTCTGPGLDLHPSKIAWYKQKAGQGGMYARLGVELAGLVEVDWSFRVREGGGPSAAAGEGGGGGAAAEGGAEGGGQPADRFACVQLDYQMTPKWNLYRCDVMGSAVNNILAVAKWLVETHQKPGQPVLKVALVGFSFGGPAVFAAVPRIPKGQLAAVACLAGSSRGGVTYARSRLDTDRGVKAAAKRNTPVLIVHGSYDINVDPQQVPRDTPGPVAWACVRERARERERERENERDRERQREGDRESVRVCV